MDLSTQNIYEKIKVMEIAPITCIIHQYINSPPRVYSLHADQIRFIEKYSLMFNKFIYIIEFIAEKKKLTVFIIDSTSSSFDTSPPNVRA